MTTTAWRKSPTEHLLCFCDTSLTFQHFMKILPLKDDEWVKSKCKTNWGHRLRFGDNIPRKHLNLSKLDFVSEEGHSGCKSRNIAIRALKGNVLCQRWFEWTYEANCEVPQRTSSHLAIIVSRALQPKEGGIPCPLERNLEIFWTLL